MKIMPTVFLISIASIAWGQEFDSIVDFGVELSSLDNPLAVQEAVRDGRIVILEGLMGDTVIEEDDSGTRVWVTLVGGSWIGTDEVRAYSCKILFEGERWIEAFPGVEPREPSESYVPQGSRLIVAAKMIGSEDGTGIPLAEMVDYRVLR